MVARQRRLAGPISRFYLLLAVLWLLMAGVNLWPYYYWMRPIHPWWFVGGSQLSTGSEFDRILGIPLVAVCPWACFYFAFVYYREARNRSSLYFKYIASLLAALGGSGYIITVCAKEYLFYQRFQTFVFHDWVLIGLHVILWLWGGFGLGLLPVNQMSSRLWFLISLALSVWLSWSTGANPWFHEVQVTAVILAFSTTWIYAAVPWLPKPNWAVFNLALSRFKLYRPKKART